jgi:hypothetical protein
MDAATREVCSGMSMDTLPLTKGMAVTEGAAARRSIQLLLHPEDNAINRNEIKTSLANSGQWRRVTRFKFNKKISVKITAGTLGRILARNCQKESPTKHKKRSPYV